MTAIAISEPGGPRVLKPEKRDVPQPGPGEILIRVRAAGVNRPDVQQRKGALSRRRPARPTCRGWRSPAKWRPLGERDIALARRRPRLRADAGRRLCRICHGACQQRAAAAGRLHLHRSRGAAGELLHRLAQCVRARRPEERRDAARAWRLVGHRHHGDPACVGLRRLCRSPPRARRRNATPA